MMKRLYIVGNGFDLYHGLPTSYKCFNCFMCREHPEEHERIGRMFDLRDANALWSDFENKLGELDVLGLVKRNLENWINEEDYLVDNGYDELHNKLILSFQDWIKQIEPHFANSKRLKLDKTARFISFNYINTLKVLYQIPENQICYIHGNLSENPDLSPIFGHGRSSCEVLRSIAEKSKDIKSNISEINELPDWAQTKDDLEERIVCKICKFLNDLKKKPAENIRNNESFFNSVSSLDEIYVLGHSLAEVDLPYFERIALDSRKAKWCASYKTDKDKENIENMRKVCGIDHIELITLDDLLKKE